MTGPNPAGQLAPYRRSLPPIDAHAATQARGTFVRRKQLAKDAAADLIRALADLDHLDRDGYLDVGVDRLDMRVTDVARSVTAVREAMADVVALNDRLHARTTADAAPTT